MKSTNRSVVVAAVALVAALVPMQAPTNALFGLGDIADPNASSIAGATSSHPRVLFDATEVEGIRTRIRSGVGADAAASLRRKVEGYTNPLSPSYVNVALVDNPADPADPDYRYLDDDTAQSQSGVYLTELAFAYLAFGERKYGRHAVDLLVALSKRWPAWHDNELGRGDMTKGVGLAFDWTYDLMAPAERRLLTDRLVAELPTVNATTGRVRNDVYEGDKLFSCLDDDWPNNRNGRAHNWMGVCGGGNGLTLLAIDGELGVPDLGPWLAEAREVVLRHFQMTYGAGGDGAEGHLYGAYGLQNSIPFALAWERARGESLTAQSPGLLNVPEWLSYERLPGKSMQFAPRNDANVFNQRWLDVLPMFFAVRPDGVPAWLWDTSVGPDGDNTFARAAHPVTGIFPGCGDPENNTGMWAGQPCYVAAEVFTILYYRPPAERARTAPSAVLEPSRFYPERGLVDLRTGWSADGRDVLVTFEAKHDHSDNLGHYQSDVGSFTLYAHDANLAIDSGYGHHYSCNQFWTMTDSCRTGDARTDTGRAIGHNVVIVDDDPETQFVRAPKTSFETIRSFVDSRGLAVVRSDLRSAYAADPTTIPLAERDLVFRRPASGPTILAVTDRLRRDDNPHEYTWQMHTDAANAVALDGDRFSITVTNGAALVGAVADAHTTRQITVAPFKARTSDIASATPIHTVVKSVTSDPAQQDLDHLAVLAVSAPGEDPAAVSPLPCSGCAAASVTWTTGEMLIGSAAQSSPGISTDRLRSDGRVASATVGGGESSLDDGRVLTVDGVTYVQVDGGPADVVVSGNRVVASGAAGNTYRVFAPNPIVEVTLNGAPVAHGRDGDFVVFPKPVFSLAVVPDSVAAAKNTDVTIDVSLASEWGFDGDVALTVAGLGPAFAVGFDPAASRVAGTTPTTASLHVRAGPKVQPGRYVFDVVASGGGVSRRASVRFDVLDDG